MKRILLYFLAGLFLFSLFCCEEEEKNPVPVISGLSPASKVVNMPTFELFVTGSNFVGGSNIVFNNVEKETTFISSTELSCMIEPFEINPAAVMQGEHGAGANHNAEDYQVEVFVRAPAPGGGDSSSLPFTVKNNHTFSTPSQVTNNEKGLNAKIAIDDENNINMVYGHATSSWKENATVYFRRSTDSGETWTNPKQVNSNNHSYSCPCEIKVLSGGKLLVVYDYLDTNSFKRYYFQTVSADNGKTWSNPTAFFPTSIQSSCITCHIINENKAYYAYTLYDGKPTPALGYEMKFIKRINNTWGPEQTISSGYFSHCTSINIDDEGNIYLYYGQADKDQIHSICCTRSGDGGQTWSSPEEITGITGKYNYVMGPYVCELSNNIILFWEEVTFTSSAGISVKPEFTGGINKAGMKKSLALYGDLEHKAKALTGEEKFYFRLSDGYGEPWGAKTEVNLGVDYRYDIWHPYIYNDSADNLNLFVYKIVNTPGTHTFDLYRTYYSRSTDLGQSWTKPVRLCNGSAGAYQARCAVLPGGDLYVLWSQHQNPNDRCGWEIMFSKTTE